MKLKKLLKPVCLSEIKKQYAIFYIVIYIQSLKANSSVILIFLLTGHRIYAIRCVNADIFILADLFVR